MNKPLFRIVNIFGAVGWIFIGINSTPIVWSENWGFGLGVAFACFTLVLLCIIQATGGRVEVVHND